MKSKEDRLEIIKIALDMLESGLNRELIEESLAAAIDYDGMADLLKLWRDTNNETQERLKIIDDLKGMLERVKEKIVWWESDYFKGDVKK